MLFIWKSFPQTVQLPSQITLTKFFFLHFVPGGPVGNVSLHSSNDSGFSNDPPPQPEIDYSDDDSIPGQTKLPSRWVPIYTDTPLWHFMPHHDATPFGRLRWRGDHNIIACLLEHVTFDIAWQCVSSTGKRQSICLVGADNKNIVHENIAISLNEKYFIAFDVCWIYNNWNEIRKMSPIKEAILLNTSV